MSDLVVNIRFWYWHLQIGKGFSSIRWVKNQMWVQQGLKGVKKIEVYEFF